MTIWGPAAGFPPNGSQLRFAKISAQGKHNLALTIDGTVVPWGQNVFFGGSDAPAELNGFKAIAAGEDHNLALREDGTVVAWGYNDFGQTDVPAGLSDVVAIAAGTEMSLALLADGTLVPWGGGDVPSGITDVVAITTQLALKSDGTVVRLNGPNDLPTGLNHVIAIASDDLGDHRLAVNADGTVIAWGKNWYGNPTFPVG